MTAPCIGIDLGTTNSCVGVWKDGKVEIIPNLEGKNTTPSMVSFGVKERKVGGPAANAASINPENTIYGAKRLIGLKFEDPSVQDAIKLVSFAIREGENGKPLIWINHKGEEKSFQAEEIASMVLSKMRESVQDHMKNFEIKDAVITVPAYFNDAQRSATKDAGMIAGLNVLRVINEPTAAAIAYGIDRSTNSGAVLVYDFGGGTLDCTLLSIDGGTFTVKGTKGNCKLGGEDFDNALVMHCVDEFEKAEGYDLTKSKKAMRRLKNACE
jgi:L1 cell adhesion molecule like protein